MDEQQRELRKAQIAEMQIALQVALAKLDELEKRLPKRKSTDRADADLNNLLANQVALGMTKAGIIPNKP